jgi:hypothetical protein
MNSHLDSPLTGECKVGRMSASVTIGEFSRLTHLTVMEAELSRTRTIVASLRALLTSTVALDVRRRILPDLAGVR